MMIKPMMRNVLFLSFSVMYLCSFAQDEHFVYNVKRSYFEIISNRPSIEFWASPTKLLEKRGKKMTLYLFSENKKIVFSKNKDKYVELPLKNVANIEPGNLHKARGYKPIYKWIHKPTLRDSVINNTKCKIYETRGISEYSEKKVNICSANPGISKSKYFINHYMKTLNNNDLQLYSKAPYKNQLLMYKKELIIPPNPVPKSYWIETVLSKAEIGKAPEGTFEIPSTSIKVNSINDL